MRTCQRPACKRTEGLIGGYCSDTCLQADTDLDLPPVIVLAPNKAGGFGTDIHWAIRRPVHLPRNL